MSPKSDNAELSESDKRNILRGSKVKFQLLDKDNKPVYEAEVSPRSKEVKLGGYLDRYKENPDRVSLGSISFKHVGKLTAFYYITEPETLYIGRTHKDERAYDTIGDDDAKRMWSWMMKIANYKNIIGQYTSKKIRKRIKRYKDENRELRRREKKAEVKLKPKNKRNFKIKPEKEDRKC